MIAEIWKYTSNNRLLYHRISGAAAKPSRILDKENREKKDVVNYTYIVMCKDGTYYTGWTNNLQKRIDDHNAGKGAKYTKSRLPVELMYYETFDTKEEAMRREYAIKRLSRKEKEKLIK